MTYQTGSKTQLRTRSDWGFFCSMFVPRSWRVFGIRIFLAINNLEENIKHFTTVTKSWRGMDHEKGDCRSRAHLMAQRAGQTQTGFALAQGREGQFLPFCRETSCSSAVENFVPGSSDFLEGSELQAAEELHEFPMHILETGGHSSVLPSLSSNLEAFCFLKLLLQVLHDP